LPEINFRGCAAARLCRLTVAVLSGSYVSDLSFVGNLRQPASTLYATGKRQQCAMLTGLSV
jgi:hypothetical protein